MYKLDTLYYSRPIVKGLDGDVLLNYGLVVYGVPGEIELYFETTQERNNAVEELQDKYGDVIYEFTKFKIKREE